MSAADWPMFAGERMVPLPLMAERWGYTLPALVLQATTDGGLIWHRVEHGHATDTALNALYSNPHAPLPFTGWVGSARVAMADGTWGSLGFRLRHADDGAREEGRVSISQGIHGPYHVRFTDARRLAVRLGADMATLDAPPATIQTGMPDWARDWEAIVAALNPADEGFNPELAAAYWLWIEVYRAASARLRPNLGPADYEKKVEEAWTTVHLPRAAPVLNGALRARICAVANPNPKRGGRPNGSKTKVVDARNR